MKVKNFKRFSLKMFRCEARVFPVGTATSVHNKLAIFYSAENVHAYESGHVSSGHFVLGRDVLCEFDYWPLAVSMPPTKVCPAVPVRRKTCERCDLVFRFKRKAEREKTV